MTSSIDELDLSWTEEYLRTTEGGITYEAEFMNNISVHLLFANTENEIIHQIEKTLPLTITENGTSSLLSQNQILELIQNHREFEKKRYKCNSIVKYHIHIDPEIIIDNIDDPSFTFHDKDCFTSYELPCDILFPPSLFIFHSMNSVYILFQEMVLVNPSISPTSIIKKSGQYKKTKKKVRISDKVTFHHQKTRKYKETT